MLTFTRTFCRAANLKALLAQPGLSPVLDQLKPSFEQQYPNELKGSTLNDVLSSEGYFEASEDLEWNPAVKEIDLSREVLNALKVKLNQDSTNITFVTDPSQPGSLLVPTAQRLRNVKAKGVTFSPVKHSEGNSSVLFRTPGSDIIVAGQIQDIFQPVLLSEAFRMDTCPKSILYQNGHFATGQIAKMMCCLRRVRQ